MLSIFGLPALDFCLHSICRSLVVDRFTRVRLLLRTGDPLKVKALTAVARIAVWNRNKIVSAISLAIWATNVGFLIHGKSLLSIILKLLLILF